MPTIRITAITGGIDPQDFEYPEGLLPVYIHELSRVCENKYRREHLKTVVTIDGLSPDKWLEQNQEELPVQKYVLGKSIEQVALQLVSGETP